MFFFVIILKWFWDVFIEVYVYRNLEWFFLSWVIGWGSGLVLEGEGIVCLFFLGLFGKLSIIGFV